MASASRTSRGEFQVLCNQFQQLTLKFGKAIFRLFHSHLGQRRREMQAQQGRRGRAEEENHFWNFTLSFLFETQKKYFAGDPVARPLPPKPWPFISLSLSPFTDDNREISSPIIIAHYRLPSVHVLWESKDKEGEELAGRSQFLRFRFVMGTIGFSPSIRRPKNSILWQQIARWALISLFSPSYSSNKKARWRVKKYWKQWWWRFKNIENNNSDYELSMSCKFQTFFHCKMPKCLPDPGLTRNRVFSLHHFCFLNSLL